MTKPTKQKEDSWKTNWRMDLDDIVEDMESYTELPSNLSYQDELHKRIYEYGLEFISTQISQAKAEVIEEIRKKTIELSWSEDQDGLMAFENGWNKAISEIKTILNKLTPEEI